MSDRTIGVAGVLALAIAVGLLALCNSSCDDDRREPQPVPAPAPAPPPGPEAVAPGSYVNHVGNPAAGSWGPDGQWQWKNPESPEADSTMKYLAAAGVGAAGGALLSHYMTKSSFEERNPGGQWSEAQSTREVKTYIDRKGNPISEDEYRRRRAQSERDKARHRSKMVQPQSGGAKAKGNKFKSVTKTQTRPPRGTAAKTRSWGSTRSRSSSRGFRSRGRR